MQARAHPHDEIAGGQQQAHVPEGLARQPLDQIPPYCRRYLLLPDYKPQARAAFRPRAIKQLEMFAAVTAAKSKNG